MFPCQPFWGAHAPASLAALSGRLEIRTLAARVWNPADTTYAISRSGGRTGNRTQIVRTTTARLAISRSSRKVPLLGIEPSQPGSKPSVRVQRQRRSGYDGTRTRDLRRDRATDTPTVLRNRISLSGIEPPVQPSQGQHRIHRQGV